MNVPSFVLKDQPTQHQSDDAFEQFLDWILYILHACCDILV